jgi:hypothetical protein
MFKELKSTSINGEMWKKTKKALYNTENTMFLFDFLYYER